MITCPRCLAQREERQTIKSALCRRCFSRLDDIDEIAVERASEGWVTVLNRGERLAAIHLLERRGFPQDQIAEQLRLDVKSIERELALERIAARQEGAA